MIPVSPRRIFLARGCTDMRKQFDTLASLVRSQLGEDPLSGDAFVFVGRRRNRLKVRWNATLHEFYVKLLAKGKRKMVALIACARKLLIRLNSLLAAAAKTTQETAQMAGK